MGKGVKMKPLSDMDYVELYEERLKKDSRLFVQQKMLIESQLRSSSETFRRMFGKKHFRSNARGYLRKTGLLR